MFRTAKRAGERVEEAGIYWVHHYAHRISHPARIAEGDLFPGCRVCGDRVRFEQTSIQVQELHQEALPIAQCVDFKEAA